jgi:hypothetical protein
VLKESKHDACGIIRDDEKRRTSTWLALTALRIHEPILAQWGFRDSLTMNNS